MDAQSSASRTSSSSDTTPSKKRRATTGASNQGLGVAVPVRTEPQRKRGGLPLLLCTPGTENPILAALGGTPRSDAAVANGFPEPEPLDLSQCSAEEKMETSVEHVKEETTRDTIVKEEKVNVMKLKQERKPHAVKTESAGLETKYTVDAALFVGKRKREDESDEDKSTDFVAYAREHIHSQEAGEEGFSIDPSERAVEHRASKVVRREILIASPAANDDEDWEGNAPLETIMEEVEAVLTPSEHFDLQPIDIILHVFSFLVTAKDLQNMAQVSKNVTPEGSVNWINFKNLGIKNKGTEGTCIKCCQRSTGKILAMKKARGEGVPYYMLRELAVLKGIKHDHIASLELISLAKDELHVFFPYVDKTLHEIINPSGDPNGGRVLPEAVLLVYNPDQRITAEDALRHPYFSSEAPSFLPLTPKIPMDQMCYTMSRARIGPTPEHVELFHAYLRQTELDSWKEIKYLSRQKTLRPAHRSMLVDWLIEVVDVFEMCLRTAFLAVNYTDRYLDIVMVKKTQFQLLGATCLHVASKCEDVSYIGVEDLAMCADNVYTSVEVLEMEEKLLNTLNFTLSVPTALDFLNIYERMIPPIQKKTSMLAHYLLELALQEYQFLKYLPSVVAACCLSMAMYTMDGFPMTKELVDACQYNWLDLKECMGELQTLYSNSPSNNLAVIKKRYSKAERCQVANVLPPTSFSMAF
ncbi:Cyclin-like [Phytophthora cactorum]|nr:Cyclin-like [Phytophthora cactorum]